MRKEEKEHLFETISNQDKKLDMVLRALNGDELNQYPGLIAEQKKDNEFREFVTGSLTEITRNQKNQMQINTEVHERLEAIEVFVKFFTTLGKMKKSTWMIIGGLIAGAGWVMLNLEKMFHWVYRITH